MKKYYYSGMIFLISILLLTESCQNSVHTSTKNQYNELVTQVLKCNRFFLERGLLSKPFQEFQKILLQSNMNHRKTKVILILNHLY